MIRAAPRSLLAALLLSLLSLAAPARAGINPSEWAFGQFWEDSEVSAWRLPPALWLAAHDRIARDILELTDDQHDALAAIVEGAEKEFTLAWLDRKETLIDEDLRDRIKEADEDEGDYDAWDERWKRMRKIRSELHELRRTLFTQVLTDLRLVATPEQADKWPDLERAMRRNFTLLHLANYRLEALDLDALIRGMEPPPDVLAAIDPVLHSYLVELDILLTTRDQAADALETEAIKARDLSESVEESEDDRGASRRDIRRAQRGAESVVRAAARTLDASKRIADLNAATLTQLQDKLPAAIADEIHKIANSPLYARRNNDWDQTEAHAALHLAENLTTFSDSLSQDTIWSGTSGSVAGIARLRAAVKPLTREQTAKIRDLRKSFETEDLALRNRLQPGDDADPDRSSWIYLRVRSGTVYLYRTEAGEEESERHQRREREFQKKHAELILDTIKKVREILDPDQRMLVAAYMW